MTTDNVKDLENLTLEQFLNNAQSQQASDVHIAIGDVPYVRIQGILKASSDVVINELIFGNWLKSVFNVHEIEQIESGYPLQIFRQYPFGAVSISCFLTLQSPVMAIRFLPQNIPTLDKLGIPTALRNICQQSSQGLILITGVIGSGKMTTLASLVNDLHQEKSRKIFVIGEAVNYVYQNHQSLMNQWVVGIHTPNVVEGVLTALKNDADIIVLNELSDRPTVDVALRAARSGTLVLACMQTGRSIATIQELFSFYSTHEQDFIRFRLADSLKAILSQRLVPTLTGEYKRAAIFDLLLTNDHVRRYILEGRVENLFLLMQQDQIFGMSTLEMGLQELLNSERITQQTFTETLQKINS